MFMQPFPLGMAKYIFYKEKRGVKFSGMVRALLMYE